MKKNVILAMSGGVDSSVAAYLLKQKGYSVIGITFKVWPRSLCGAHGAKSCCSQEAVDDARLVCSRLAIPHYVIGCESIFKKRVIGYFLRSYKNGRTPNPCIVCNQRVKFPLLLQKAKETDSEYFATGHHARSLYDRMTRRFLIREAKDKSKDQSYVLFNLNQDTLSRLLLPVGDYNKEKIRDIAKKCRLRVCQKKESQEICFIPDSNLKKFLRENIGGKLKGGVIKGSDGNILGRHHGTPLFTIGQRKGLCIPFGRPLYVTDIRQRSREVIVGGYKETLSKSLIATNVSWAQRLNVTRPIKAQVKIRYRHPKASAKIYMLTSNSARAIFSRPQSSPSPGQAAVFYKKDVVIGGGWIA